MRKPRDIDAELRALAQRAKDLKSMKIAQLGELVIATGADALPLEALAGALLAAQDASAADQAAWRTRGAAFFRDPRTATAPGRPAKPSADASPGDERP